MTNARIMRAIDTAFTPKHRGILSGEEVALITSLIKFDNFKTEDDLRNLRDCAVMYYTIKEMENDTDASKVIELTDKMSGIVCVIDKEIWKRGYEV